MSSGSWIDPLYGAFTSARDSLTGVAAKKTAQVAECEEIERAFNRGVAFSEEKLREIGHKERELGHLTGPIVAFQLQQANKVLDSLTLFQSIDLNALKRSAINIRDNKSRKTGIAKQSFNVEPMSIKSARELAKLLSIVKLHTYNESHRTTTKSSIAEIERELSTHKARKRLTFPEIEIMMHNTEHWFPPTVEKIHDYVNGLDKLVELYMECIPLLAFLDEIPQYPDAVLQRCADFMKPQVRDQIREMHRLRYYQTRVIEFMSQVDDGRLMHQLKELKQRIHPIYWALNPPVDGGKHRSRRHRIRRHRSRRHQTRRHRAN